MSTAKTLNDAIEDYLEARFDALTPTTRKAHEGQIERFRTWVSRPSECGPYCLLADIDAKVMSRYFHRMRATGVTGSTYNNYRQYLRRFWQFCLGEAWTQTNPMRHIDPMPVIRKTRLQLSATELGQMLQVADNPRDRYALAVGMNTAFRAGDIAALTVGSVNLTNNTITAFIAKTKTWDEMPMTEELQEETVRWFEHYARAMGLSDWRRDLPNSWTLVPPIQFTATNVWRPELGGALKYKTDRRYAHPEQIVQRALARMGHPTKGEGFHTLRRSTARRFLELAAAEGDFSPIRAAQALLGHKSQLTTEIYLGVTEDKRRRDELMRNRRFLSKVAEEEAEQSTSNSSTSPRPDRTEGHGLSAVI